MIELYPDQQEALDAVLAVYKQQPKGGKALVVAPPGWGKTIFFSSLARELKGRTILIIAHRDELLNQAIDKLHMVDATAIIGKVGGGTHQYGGQITVAGIDTISRPQHLKNLHTFGYDVIICDECHHAPAAKYQKVFHALPHAFRLGVTATPTRLDGLSLEPHFGSAVFCMTILDAIRQKRLTDVKAIAIKTETDLDTIGSSKNSDGEMDFNQQELAEAVDNPARNKRVVDAYIEHAHGRRAICFCVTVQHAHSLTYTFNDHGIDAAVISGDTSPQERARLYKAFRTGAIKILCTVLVLTEGFDEPLVSCVIMARPTQSQGLYIQCIGRGLRLAPAKRDCLILDLTDNCLKHRLLPQNLRRAMNVEVEDDELLSAAIIREEEERSDKEAQEKRALIRRLNEKRDKDVAIDLFALPEWQEKPGGMYTLEVGIEKHRIAITPCKGGSGFYDVWARLAPNFNTGQKWLASQTLDYALQFAEKRAHMLIAKPGSVALVDQNADWRQQSISDGQIRYLNWKKIPWHEGMTKGEASDLIDKHKQEQEERKAKRAARAAEKAKVSV